MRGDVEEMWSTALTEALGEGFKGHEVLFVENNEGGHKWSTEIKNGVKEAYGDPAKITIFLRVIEVVLSGYAPFTREMMEAPPELKLIGVSRGGPVNVTTGWPPSET